MRDWARENWDRARLWVALKCMRLAFRVHARAVEHAVPNRIVVVTVPGGRPRAQA
jgi:hypothetical protein